MKPAVNWGTGLVLGFLGGGVAGYHLIIRWYYNQPVSDYTGSYEPEHDELAGVAEYIFLAIFGTCVGAAVGAILGAVLLHYVAAWLNSDSKK